MTSQALLERGRRHNENGINGKIDRMLQDERMRNIITELSREMITWRRKQIDLTRTNEQHKRQDTVEELKGDYQRTIEHTENTIIELDSFLFGSSFDCESHDFSLNSKILKFRPHDGILPLGPLPPKYLRNAQSTLFRQTTVLRGTQAQLAKVDIQAHSSKLFSNCNKMSSGWEEKEFTAVSFPG